VFAILVVLYVVFAMLRFQHFASPANVRNILSDAATLLVLGVGMTFVIICAGLDLSVGMVLIFSGVIAAKTMVVFGGVDAGWGGILLGIAAGLAAGAAWGLLNGLLVTKAHVPPFIVTLGTLGMALGFAQLLTGGVDVRDVPDRLSSTLGNGLLFGQIPYLVIVALAVAAIGALVLATTRFGRYSLAVGSNDEAARRAGINVNLHLIKVYTLSGLLAGVAGVLDLARFDTTTLTGHTTDNLSAIAGVVLGGTSLFGGVGSVIGTVIGVLIPAVLQNGFTILGVQTFWQSVAVGAVLILAVYFDQLRRRARTRR
jgi:ribose transport system permease protein